MSEVLSEVLTKKDFDKVLPIIEILQEKGSITPGEAVKVYDRSPARVFFKVNSIEGNRGGFG